MIDWSWAWWLPTLLAVLEEDDTPYVWLPIQTRSIAGLYRMALLAVES